MLGKYFACALVALALLAPAASRAGTEEAIPVVDLHVDLSYQHRYKGQSFRDGSGQYRAELLVKGGVKGVVLPLFVPTNVSETGPRVRDLEESYASVFSALTELSEYALPGCIPAGTRAQTFLAFEGAGPLADDPDALVSWVARGLKILGLVHTSSNELASSSSDRNPRYGLTDKGRTLVRKAYELGIVVDVSHASDLAVTDVLRVAKDFAAPVIATHSNARKLMNHSRNLSDAQLRAIADSGGVVGVNFHSPFLVKGRRAKISDVVRHMQHVLRVAGEDSVAIGSDFEGGITPPVELADASKFPVLADALLAAGVPRGSVEKIFYRNALRVLCRPLPSRPN